MADVWDAVKSLGKGLGWCGVQAAQHPRSTVAVVAPSVAVWQVGYYTVAMVVAVIPALLGVWCATHWRSFRFCIAAPTRNYARHWCKYGLTWKRVVDRCGLTITSELSGERYSPRIKRVRTDRYWDQVTIKLEIGQETEHFQGAAERLRHAWVSERVAVSEVRPRILRLDVMRRDPFREIAVPSTVMSATVEDINWTQIPIGIDEHLEPVTVSALGGTHTLVAGATGAGKAGPSWNIYRHLAPGIAAGLVRPIFIDPKSVELYQGAPLVAAGDYVRGEWDTVELLERIASELTKHAGEVAALGERDFTPSLLRPLRPIDIDEMAMLTAYWSSPAMKRITAALGTILTQGRAFGYWVIGKVQEPTKDTVPQRELFPVRVALRLPKESHVDAALIDGAVEQGAMSHRISMDQPGVGYLLPSGAKSARRIRVGHVTNDDITALLKHVSTLGGALTPHEVHDEWLTKQGQARQDVIKAAQQADQERAARRAARMQRAAELTV